MHEAPVYVATVQRLFASRLALPPGFLPQLVVDLSWGTPRLERSAGLCAEWETFAGVWFIGVGIFEFRVSENAGNAGVFVVLEALLTGIVGASGGNMSTGGMEQRPGIRTLDPMTNKMEMLLNNYFGYYFNTMDDLVVDAKGDVWLADPREWLFSLLPF